MAPYSTVLPAIAWPAGSTGRSGSGTMTSFPPREALADVVVRLPRQAQLDGRTGEGAEALAGRPVQVERDRAAQRAALDGAGQGRAERPIRGGDLQAADADRALAVECGGDPRLERGRRGVADDPRRRGRVGAAAGACRPGRRPHDRPEVRGGSSDRDQEPLRLADHLANGARAERGQLAPEVLGQREREALDLLRGTRELGAQILALRRDTGGTRIEVALAGHIAADRDERCGPEREFLGADQRGNEKVPAGLQPAVGAQRDAVAQIVAQQDLVDFGEAELPRRADVLDRRQRRGAGPARMPGEMDVRCAGLGDARGDRADPAARDQLDADPGTGVDRAQVGDELRQVLDRVDVVVRWRADVALARLAAAQRRDVGRRLAARQLAALAGLGALRDLDLELVGAGEVRGGHPEACRRHLLDLRIVTAALRVGQVPRRILAALAGVRGAAGPLDPDGERLVRLGAQRTDAHGGNDEAAHDRAR